MNNFKDVIDIFLNLVSEINYLDYEEEELYQELGIKTKVVISKARIMKDLSFDKETNDFSRQVTDFEATILAHGLVVEWLSPKLHNWELLETQMSSKDFSVYSNANRISEMRNMRNDSKGEFYSLITDYDFDMFMDGVE